MDDRLIQIRENEKKSHIETYTHEKLYNGNGWLQKPIKTVQEILPLFDDYRKLRVLDLGCGVGRNSIFVEEKYRNIDCTVDCVDLLEIAIEKLKQNAGNYSVSKKINGIVQSIEEYDICCNSYDFIMAISALEHVDNEESFLRKLSEIKSGIRENGIVCLVINSNIREINSETKEILEAQFEVNLPSEKIQSFLAETFSGWNVLKASVRAQEYDIPRDSGISRLYTDVVTYVARK